MSRSIYDLTNAIVDPVDDLLKALVALNFHAFAANEAGWLIEFAVNPDHGQVTVCIARSNYPVEINEGDQ